MPRIGEPTSLANHVEGPQGIYRELPLAACTPLVLKHHYSHRLPSVVKLCYGDVIYGPPRVTRACCLFSMATGRWQDQLWELTRLVRLPDYREPLTKLVSKAIGHIRKHSMTDLIVSFADSEEDHHGGIYQACSWIYDGMRGTRLDGFNIDGVFVPARTVNATYGTSSEVELPKLLNGQSVEPHYDCGKHCYWKPLTKSGMRKAVALGLGSRPYPKPMLGTTRIGNGEIATNARVGADHRRKGIVTLPSVGRAVERDLDALRGLRLGQDAAADGGLDLPNGAKENPGS